jgi:hypothetical protein
MLFSGEGNYIAALIFNNKAVVSEFEVTGNV